jgi:DNA-binding SARP family transcriptional activator
VADTEFCLLGPLLVRRAGTTVPVSSAKQRVVLATLLLNRGRVVRTDELAAAIWGATPPRTAAVTARNYVKRLRQALEVAGLSRIRTYPGGYLIDADPDEVDVSRFESLLRDARDASRAGMHEMAADRLRAALSLWRGQPLADVPSELLASREVPRLEEMRLQAAEARLDAELQLGHHAEAIIELKQLVTAYPLRERLPAALMLALYRNGQQADALAVYTAARRTLADELGCEPGPELREAQRQILAADPVPVPAPAAPATAGTSTDTNATAGTNAETTAGPNASAGMNAETNAGPNASAGMNAETNASPGKDTDSDTDAGKYSRTAVAPVPRQLPADAPCFVGRRAELSTLDRLPEQAAGAAGTVVISAIGGTAGVGKTALAVHWAHRAARWFPDGQLYVDLRGFGPTEEPMTPAEAVRLLLDGLGVAPERVPAELDAGTALYRSLLADKKMLVLLDNAHDTGQLRPLLPAAPGCLVLVTSRNQLTGLAATHGARLLALDVLTDAEALELLGRRLGSARACAETVAVTELTGLCARLPLALSITAAQAIVRGALSLAELATELRGSPDRLDPLEGGDPATDLRRVFSWSYRQLSDPAARMFRLLGVHPGPDISAAAAASLAGLPPERARPALAELAAANLITQPAAGRYAFHDLLRAYAADQAGIVESGRALRAARRRIGDHYLHTANAASLCATPHRELVTLSRPQPGVRPEEMTSLAQALEWFQAERRVLIAVIGQAAGAGSGALAWQLPWAVAPLLDARGFWHELLATQQTALDAARRLGDLVAQAHAYHFIGRAHISLGAAGKAVTQLTASLELARQLGADAIEARAHATLAIAYIQQDRFRDALSHAWQSGRLARACGHRFGEAHSLNSIGWCHAQLGNYQLTLSCCQRALAMYRELGDQRGEAAALDSLGYAHHRLGNHAAAITCYTEAIDLLGDTGDPDDRAEFLTHLGDACLSAGDHEAARRAWRQGLADLDDRQHPAADRLRSRLARPATSPLQGGYHSRKS